MQKIDHGNPTIDAARIREVIDVTRVWLGIGEVRKVRQLTALAPDEVLHALQAGECAAWQGWSIRTTPPRRIGLPLGQAEWVVGIIAVSAYGFVSGLRVAVECVQRICAEIVEIESRRAAHCAAEISNPGLFEWGLEDS